MLLKGSINAFAIQLTQSVSLHSRANKDRETDHSSLKADGLTVTPKKGDCQEIGSISLSLSRLAAKKKYPGCKEKYQFRIFMRGPAASPPEIVKIGGIHFAYQVSD